MVQLFSRDHEMWHLCRIPMKNNFLPIAGLLGFIALYAMIISRFQTGLLFIILPIGLLLFHFSKHPYIEIGLGKYFLGLLISSGIWSGLFFGNYISPNADFVLLSGDLQFYSRLSEFLNIRAVENTSLDYLNQNLDFIPYHYTELWLGAAISKLTGLHHDVSYVLAISLVIWAVIYYYLIILVKILLKRETLLNYILPFIFIVVGIVEIIYPKWISLINQDVWNIPLLSKGKLAIVSAVVLPGVIAYYHKDYLASLGCLLVAALVYFPVLPAYCLIAFCVLLFLIYKKIISFDRQLVCFALIFILSFSGYAWFYFFQKTEVLSAGDEIYTIGSFFSGSYISTWINVTGKTSLSVILCSLPFFILYYIIKRDAKSNDLVGICIFTYFCTIFTWAFMHPLTDSVQLWSNAFFPLYHIAIFALIVYAIRQAPIQGYVFLVMFFVVKIYESEFEYQENALIYSQRDVEPLAKFVGLEPNSMIAQSNVVQFAYYRDWSEVETFFQLKSGVYPPLLEFRLFGIFAPICLNVEKMPISANSHTKKDEIKIKQKDPFGIYKQGDGKQFKFAGSQNVILKQVYFIGHPFSYQGETNIISDSLLVIAYNDFMIFDSNLIHNKLFILK